MVSAVAAPSRPPPLSTQKRREPRGGVLREVLCVARCDREFIGKRLRPLRDRLSKAVEDLFWLRSLEDPRVLNASRPHSRRPKLSYPPGLSGIDLLMADIESLGMYINYLRNASTAWSIPLPEVYDPQRVADYFRCRPHVLAFRILEVFSLVGLAAVKLHFSGSFNLSKSSTENKRSSSSSQHYIGQLLKESILNLGPTFIKVGQSLSTRPDIIGSEIAEVLCELHDKVPPFPRSVAMKIVEEEMGSPVNDIFSYISEEPVAAASFGQVYEGRLIDGYTVAIKVQRPNLLHVVLRDIYILRLGLALLRKVARRKSNLCLYADEIGKGLVGELDYTLEAANANKFLEAHSQFSFMLVPKVFGHLTRKRVLTMEWVTGENPNHLLLISRGSACENIGHLKGHQVDAKGRLLDLVNKGVEASLVQLLETGLLHADPHPGNLRYTSDGRVGFLDFGLLCQLEKKHQFAMLASIVHIVNGDWGALVYDLVEMEVVQPGTNLRQVIMDLEDALDEVAFQDGIPNIKFSKVLGKIWSIALKYHFRMPPYYSLVLRSLASLEGLALAADENFKTFQAAYPYVVQKLLYNNSAYCRRLLYSVVFNRRREFQWGKIFLFLRLVSTRRGKNYYSLSGTKRYRKDQIDAEEDAIEIANMMLKLLPSRNGAVIRRLIMDADPAALVRSMISKNALSFHQHISRALSDVLFFWMTEVVSRDQPSTQYGHHFTAATMHGKVEKVPSSAIPRPALCAVLGDRRLKIILYKIISNIRSDPLLMLRFFWNIFTISLTASLLALRRSLVYWSDACLTFISFVPRRFAISV